MKTVVKSINLDTFDSTHNDENEIEMITAKYNGIGQSSKNVRSTKAINLNLQGKFSNFEHNPISTKNIYGDRSRSNSVSFREQSNKQAPETN